MANNLAQLAGYKDAGNIQAINLTTGKPDLYIGYANTLKVEIKSDTVYAYAKGKKAVSWEGEREGTITLGVDLMGFDLMGFILGSSIANEKANFYKREVFTLTQAGEVVTLQAKDSDIVPNTMCAYKISDDMNTQISELSSASISTNQVTLTGGAEGDKVAVYYMTNETANTFMVKANRVLSGFYKLSMIVEGKGYADGSAIPMELEFFKVAPQANLTFEFSAKDPSSFELTLDILQDANENMFQFKQLPQA